MHPIISTLRKHFLSVFFLSFQIAVACAIIPNIIFPMSRLLQPLIQSDGFDRGNYVFAQAVASPNGFDRGKLASLEMLIRALPGVKGVSEGLGLPYWPSAPRVQLSLQSRFAAVPDTYGYLSNRLIHVLDGRMVSGSDFSQKNLSGGIDDAFHSTIILSRALAGRLFPKRNPIGEVLHIGTKPDANTVRVIGVIDNLISPNAVGSDVPSYSFIVPGWPTGSNYIDLIVKVERREEVEVIKALPKLLADALPESDHDAKVVDSSGKQFNVLSYSQARTGYFENTKSLLLLLLVIVVVILFIIIYGVSGLVVAWIKQRCKSVWIRRALGATRTDIVKYFLMENLIVSLMGLLPGIGAAYAFNAWMMRFIEIQSVPFEYVAVCALILLVVVLTTVLPVAIRISAIEMAKTV